MKEILEYFIAEKGKSPQLADRMAKKLERHEDIAKEFCRWLRDRTYEFADPVMAGGYTAKEIHELNPGFDGAGVYNFMITLREKPDAAKEMIAKGFPMK